MIRGGVVLGQEGNQSFIEFLAPRRSDSHLSFNSFNLFSASFSFGNPSQNGDDTEVKDKKKDNAPLKAFLAGQDA